jgi:hypothetical protein
MAMASSLVRIDTAEAGGCDSRGRPMVRGDLAIAQIEK